MSDNTSITVTNEKTNPETSNKNQQGEEEPMAIHLIVAIIGVAGIIAGVLLNHWLRIRRVRDAAFRDEFNHAAAVFRDSFAEAQRLLGKHYTYEVAVDRESPSVFQILDEQFVGHERAMRRFRRHIPKDRLTGFDAAWDTYCCYDDWNIPLKCYSQEGGNDPEVEIAFMKKANMQLNLLLDYAKPLKK